MHSLVVGLTDLEDSWIHYDVSTGGFDCEFAAGWKQGLDYDDLMAWRPQVDSLPVST